MLPGAEGPQPPHNEGGKGQVARAPQRRLELCQHGEGGKTLAASAAISLNGQIHKRKVYEHT